MIILLTIIHVIVCFFLIVVVLLQSGKAADLAGAFGGMGSQTAFGPRGAATLLSKATTTAAVIFMITSIWLGIEQGRSGGGGGDSVIERTGADAVIPATTETTPAESETPSGTPTPAAPAGSDWVTPESSQPSSGTEAPAPGNPEGNSPGNSP